MNAVNAEENTKFKMFLSTNRWLFSQLKTELAKAGKGSVSLLFDCANHCVDLLKGDCCVTPNEFFRTLRGVSLMLLLVPLEQCKAEKKRLPSLKPYVELIKQYPYIPLYGDMHFEPLVFINLDGGVRELLRHEDAKLGENVAEEALRHYRCTDAVEGIKKAHHDLVSQYSVAVNRLKAVLQQHAGVPCALGAEVNALVLRGIRLVSRCARVVSMQIAYKYANPTRCADAVVLSEYQRALRNNCTKDEFIAIIELVSIAKSLASTMLRDEPLLFPVIRRTVHTELCRFVGDEAAAALRAAGGKKDSGRRGVVQRSLSLLVAMFGGHGTAPSATDAKRGARKTKGVPGTLEKSAVVPTSVQLAALRNALSRLVRVRKELAPDFAKHAEACYARVRDYRALLRLGATIAECSDMGDLWYREFYLDLCKARQFPVSDSLPSILLTHLFDAMDDSVQELTELVLYPFAIYNDAASRALHVFKRRHLYDEVEAEADLCFDQFLFQLSVHLVRHFVACAASVRVDQECKTRLAPLGERVPSLEPSIARFGVITEQRTVRLLGRVVNLNAVLGQRVVAQLKERIEHALASFEAADLRAVVELDTQLGTLRAAHALLCRHFELEPFDRLLGEQNQCVSLAAYQSRVLRHVLRELADDVAPNYCYNTFTGRYVRRPGAGKPARTAAPRRGNQPYGTRGLSEFFGDALHGYGSFLGRPHVAALLRVLRASEVPVLVTTLQDAVYELLDAALCIAQRLGNALGGAVPAPRPARAKDLFRSAVRSLAPVLGDAGLPELLGLLGQAGNIVAFVHLLDSAQRAAGVERALCVSALVGTGDHTCVPPSAPVRPSASDVAVEATKYLCAHPERRRGFGFAREAIFTVKTAERAYAQALHTRSLFKAFLSYIKAYAKENEAILQDTAGYEAAQTTTATTTTTTTEMNEKGSTGLTPLGHAACAKEFHRVWALAEFAACLPQCDFRTKNGDGFVWAGAMLTCLLGQHDKHEATALNARAARLEEDPAAALDGADAEEARYIKNAAEVRCVAETVRDIVDGAVSPLPAPARTAAPPDAIVPSTLS